MNAISQKKKGTSEKLPAIERKWDALENTQLKEKSSSGFNHGEASIF